MADKNGSILVVDDTPKNIQLLGSLLKEEGYGISVARNGLEALEVADKGRPDLILLDVMMPEMDGYETLKRLKENEELLHIPVVMVSALDEADSALKCLEFGADDYLTKPINSQLLKVRVENSLAKKRLFDSREQQRKLVEKYNEELQDEVQRQVKEISDTQLSLIFALAKLAESRDPETGAHLERLAGYCEALCIALRKRERYAELLDDGYQEALVMASPLHDIGKVGVPDCILQKPGKLTPEEFDEIKKHPGLGAETLSEVDRKHPGNRFISMGIAIAAGHHEKWDGSGYPVGLSGEDIPLAARIVALGDVYDALTSKRCYKAGMSHEQAKSIILEGNGTHFDPMVVECFLECEEVFIRLQREKGD